MKGKRCLGWKMQFAPGQFEREFVGVLWAQMCKHGAGIKKVSSRNTIQEKMLKQRPLTHKSAQLRMLPNDPFLEQFVCKEVK